MSEAVDLVTQVQKLGPIGPNDVVVLTVDRRISMQQVDDLRKRAERALSGVRVLIVAEGTEARVKHRNAD